MTGTDSDISIGVEIQVQSGLRHRSSHTNHSSRVVGNHIDWVRSICDHQAHQRCSMQHVRSICITYHWVATSRE